MSNGAATWGRRRARDRGWLGQALSILWPAMAEVCRRSERLTLRRHPIPPGGATLLVDGDRIAGAHTGRLDLPEGVEVTEYDGTVLPGADPEEHSAHGISKA